MLRILHDTNVDFLAARRWAYGIGLALVATGLAALAIRGVNASIEFTGGTLIQVTGRSNAVTAASLRAALDRAGIAGSEIQNFGSAREFVIRARLDPRAAGEETTQQTAAAVRAALDTALGADAFVIERAEAIGPKVGGELRQKALTALFLAFTATLLYLWFRFEWRFAVAAILATMYDIVATIAFIAFMRLEISLVLVAAVLTIIGYSLNDKIVNFDRVRENLHKYRRANFAELLNRSINEVLPRTVMTGGGTIAAILSLLIFGGEVIRDFAWVMNFGIITGTFSSIYVAAPILLAIEQRWPGEDVHGVRPSPAPRTAAGGPPRSRRAVADRET